jgi:CubicO group peptidase (beta-lactamase class C family)
MLNLKIAFLSLLFFAGHYHVLAQDSIDLFIKQQMHDRKITGLQLAIVKGGKIIKAGSYGFSNIQDSVPVTNQTVFGINSITKAFTGVAILQLVEDKQH